MQTEIVRNCPVCNSGNFEPYLTCKDFTYSNQEFEIQKCPGCHLLITNPRPDPSSIGNYYKSADYISHTSKARNIFDHVYLKARAFNLNWKHHLITTRRPGTALLDFGCGTGEFAKKMQTKNWDVMGVEPSQLALDKARTLIGANRIYQTLDEIPNRQFDVITLWHVLEHIGQPLQLLTRLKGRLKPDGLIFVAVPNHESFDALHYQEYWAGYDVPRHFWHFTKNSMQQLLARPDLLVHEIVPMKLDAYYVSLLSERNKNNGHNLLTPLKAIITGLKSNSMASKKLNYSSLIYIARHA